MLVRGYATGQHRDGWLLSLIKASAKSPLQAGKSLTELDSYADYQEQPYK